MVFSVDEHFADQSVLNRFPALRPAIGFTSFQDALKTTCRPWLQVDSWSMTKSVSQCCVVAWLHLNTRLCALWLQRREHADTKALRFRAHSQFWSVGDMFTSETHEPLSHMRACLLTWRYFSASASCVNRRRQVSIKRCWPDQIRLCTIDTLCSNTIMVELPAVIISITWIQSGFDNKLTTGAVVSLLLPAISTRLSLSLLRLPISRLTGPPGSIQHFQRKRVTKRKV